MNNPFLCAKQTCGLLIGLTSEHQKEDLKTRMCSIPDAGFRSDWLMLNNIISSISGNKNNFKLLLATLFHHGPSGANRRR
jgi:hypothetical protein